MSETNDASQAPENEPVAPVASDEIVIPQAKRPAWMERMMAADAFENFLGVPRGGHRDPSPGEARARWPHQEMHPTSHGEPEGKVLYTFVVDSENHTVTDASREDAGSVEGT